MVFPPCLQSSLPAGWLAFTGRELNPLDRYKRFQITSLVPLFWICPGAREVSLAILPDRLYCTRVNGRGRAMRAWIDRTNDGLSRMPADGSWASPSRDLALASPPSPLQTAARCAAPSPSRRVARSLLAGGGRPLGFRPGRRRSASRRGLAATSPFARG